MRHLVRKIISTLNRINIPFLDEGIFFDKVNREEAVDLAKDLIIEFLCDPDAECGIVEVDMCFEALEALDKIKLYYSTH